MRASLPAQQSREEQMQVGFIGVGTMGAGMASNLQKAGHKLVINDLTRQAASHHLSAGGVWAETPKAVAQQCEVVFCSLPTPADVELVALGADGVLAGFKKGSVLFDLSTNSPTVVREIHAKFLEQGVHMMDAPVSGGPKGAASGKLAIWVGGDQAIFDQYKHVLDGMSDQARYVGPIGAGSVAKLVHNCAGYIIQTGLAEVFSMGVKGGVEPLALWEAVRQGAVGRSRTFDRLIDSFLINKYDPPNFALRLAHKDVSLACALGRELGVPMRLAHLTLEEMTEALGRGWAQRDSRVSMVLQQERAGVTIAVDPERAKESLAKEPRAGNDPRA
jgi:3-hydroxyisobutyrate dehydrogenase